LKRKLLWELLVRLEKSGPDDCEHETLTAARGADFSLSPAALATAMRDLREILRPLGIEIKVSRGIGYRLEEIKRKTKPAHRSRPAKTRKHHGGR
jgi:DNA-binding response OmpR family regulator